MRKWFRGVDGGEEREIRKDRVPEILHSYAVSLSDNGLKLPPRLSGAFVNYGHGVYGSFR